MSSASALRPLLAGLAGGVGGWLLSQKGAASVPDVTYEEPTPNILATGRAGEILKFGAPKEGVSGPLVYKNHVLAYDSARRVPKWVAEHLSREVANKEQVVISGQDDVLITTTRWQTGRVSTLDLILQCPRNFLVITGIGRGVRILEGIVVQGLLGKWVVSRSHGSSWEQQALSGQHEPDLLLHQCGASGFG